MVDHSFLVTTSSQESISTFYNWFGRLQDLFGFYETAPVDFMINACDIQPDSEIFEFGFGTGYLAQELLSKYPQSTYSGVDISKTMHQLATAKLTQFDAERTDLQLAMDTLGVIEALPNGSIDRFISAYVFDLLPKTMMKDVIQKLQRKLRKDGKICLVSLTKNVDDNNVLTRMVLNGWNTVSRFCNICLGGCRPINLRYPFEVQRTTFDVIVDTVQVSYGVPSQILIAQFDRTKYRKRPKK